MKRKHDQAHNERYGGVEVITKLGTLTVVILYALGLLVTNAHLMSLGIADFSALQGRFVLSGALFLVYVALLLLGPAAFAILFWLKHNFAPKLGARWWAIALPMCALSILQFEANFVGFLLPWGPSYESQWVFSWKRMGEFFVPTQQLQLLQEAFFHTKILAGSVLGVTAVASITWVTKQVSELRMAEPSPTESSAGVSGTFEGAVPLRSITRLAVAVWLAAGLGSMVLILFGYAQNVFPNLPYNLGGGQPRLIQLYVRETHPSALRANRLLAEAERDGPVASVPLALWHQDSSFLYVTQTSTSSSGAANLIAIKMETVELIKYLGGFVKVAAGGRIERAEVQGAAPSR